MENKDQHTNCPNCQSKFICKPGELQHCFCSSLAIPDKILNYMRRKFTSCLCSKCIHELIAKQHTLISIFFFLLLSHSSFAQFHAAPGSTNTSAMHKDSSAFVAWANGCTVGRGWQDAADQSLGTTTVGLDAYGTLKAGVNGVVSLGDGGTAILSFANSIKNGPGYDFAVFENGFADDFLELAFVEVSSDGINFVRFPATSNTQFTAQVGAFDPLDCTKLNNLAGKYRVDYGTPFDLEEVKNAPGLNVNAITHIKIIDVVGSITASLATHDMNTNPINDPYPTAFGSGGFDLDAVGVIHENPAGLNENSFSNSVHVFPNPCQNKLYLHCSLKEDFLISIHDVSGKLIAEQVYSNYVDLSSVENGIYFMKISCDQGSFVKKIFVSH
jgi:hypothetical protein